MNAKKLEIIYKLNSLSSLEAWRIIYSYLMNSGVSSSLIVKIYDQEVALRDVEKNIYDSGRQGFRVDLGEVSFGYGAVTAWKHILIYAESYSDEVFWDSLIKCFLDECTFIQAWVSDIEYSFWQNASDPLQYKSRGKNYDNCRLKSNGLPFPLEQIEIDISKNPGRRIMKLGYVESIGSSMWLSDEFWKRLGFNRDKIIYLFSDKITFLKDNVVKLNFSDEPFTDDTDVSLQEQIREKIYY